MKKLISFLAFCAFFILFTGFLYSEYTKLSPDSYVITFFDSQLGDSTLIQTPSGKIILIDTGSNEDVASKISKQIGVLKQSIDLLILSHGDSDHIGGSLKILSHWDVKEIFFSGAEKETPIFQEFFKQIQEKNIPYHILDKDSDFQINNDIFFDTVFPLENISYLKNHSNNESLVFLLSIFGKKILFTGDIEAETEKSILLSGQNIKADILKAPHHGSKTSSSLSFLQSIDPQYAIVQAAINNPFGHPHKEIVERYKSLGINFLQTGAEGNISFCISQEKQELWRCSPNNIGQ